MEGQPEPGPPAWFEWGGLRWYRNAKDGYYRECNGFLLHHAVWAAVHGPVPDGHQVHHRDHDRANNGYDNLELLTRSEHSSYHGKVRTDVWRDNQSSEVASVRARNAWARRQPRDVECAQCGGTFQSTGQRARFCGGNCRAAFYRARRRARLQL